MVIVAGGLYFLPAGTVRSQEKASPAAQTKINSTEVLSPTPDLSSPKVRVRLALTAWWAAYGDASSKAHILIDKLSTRITAAKAAGNDVSDAENLLQDAQKSLADADTTLNIVQKDNGAAQTRSQFLAVKNEFKSVKIDLQTVSGDSAKIISLLKSYNSATASGKNAKSSRSALPTTPSARANPSNVPVSQP